VGFTRKRPARKAIPAHLPRERVMVPGRNESVSVFPHHPATAC